MRKPSGILAVARSWAVWRCDGAGGEQPGAVAMPLLSGPCRAPVGRGAPGAFNRRALVQSAGGMPKKVWKAIFPSRITNVSVPTPNQGFASQRM